jgi:chemotaxis protein methyltransferase CheR
VAAPLLIDATELTQLLDTIHDLSGLDFRDYAPTSLVRRIERGVSNENLGTLSELNERIRVDQSALERLIDTLTIPVTTMFRDPQFFREFRTKSVPLLRTHPFLRLWVAGCSTGQEVYSLAILLHEEGLYDRARIYATELQPLALARASSGILPLAAMQEYTRNYQEAGGIEDFSSYYTADDTAAIVRPSLRSNVVFAAHNLVSDRSFNEFHVIFCRNVMIYFNRKLQRRVHTLFYDSLAMWGYLGLGRSETIRFADDAECYETVSSRERLYRKIR